MTEEITKKRILHVADETDTLQVVRTVLEKEEFEVVNASSGKKALELLDKNSFDLVILDIMMPDMSGWDLFSRIIKLSPKTPIIILSVLELAEEKPLAFRDMGVEEYIKKPFDNADLVARVKNVLGMNPGA